MGLLITNIQRMCMQDGPGIRTTVFLKGCTLSCPWCSNPENISNVKQYWFNEEKCADHRGKSDQCELCPGIKIAGHSISGNAANECPFGAMGIFGREYEATELVNALMKDMLYWKHGGGVTFSGGEPLVQAGELLPALKLLKEYSVHIALETALHIPTEAIETVLELVDLFIVDLKIVKQENYGSLQGYHSSLFGNNVNYLDNRQKELLFRVSCSDEIAQRNESAKQLKGFLRKHSRYPVELYMLHNMGSDKYRTLGLPAPIEYRGNIELMNELMEWIKTEGGDAAVIAF